MPTLVDASHLKLVFLIDGLGHAQSRDYLLVHHEVCGSTKLLFFTCLEREVDHCLVGMLKVE